MSSGGFERMHSFCRDLGSPRPAKPRPVLIHPPNQCRNVIHTGSNKASSAMVNAKSYCTLLDRYECDATGATLEIFPLTPAEFSDHGIDNKMGSYRCNLVVPSHYPYILIADVVKLPPIEVQCNISVSDAENGTEYGYVNATFQNWSLYGAPQQTQADALAVSFPEPPTDLTRLSLRALNGPTSESAYRGRFPDYYLGPRVSTYCPLAGTVDTIGTSRILSADSSYTAATYSGPFYLESAIWHYNRTMQVLTPRWINPTGEQPQTTIVLMRKCDYNNDQGTPTIVRYSGNATPLVVQKVSWLTFKGALQGLGMGCRYMMEIISPQTTPHSRARTAR
ncbi:hypothetical protein DFH07DRAFT_14301 [Mycena maculata]|uniref:Uncharacterized protein n=1 Tax=Mycena maculata TaxID=230809 RepID=A0AAD7N628_9AGAR|nr:hypothetical protein DFH07DRAFT_14301 [Mycena maculata]